MEYKNAKISWFSELLRLLFFVETLPMKSNRSSYISLNTIWNLIQSIVRDWLAKEKNHPLRKLLFRQTNSSDFILWCWMWFVCHRNQIETVGRSFLVHFSFITNVFYLYKRQNSKSIQMNPFRQLSIRKISLKYGHQKKYLFWESINSCITEYICYVSYVTYTLNYLKRNCSMEIVCVYLYNKMPAFNQIYTMLVWEMRCWSMPNAFC